MVSAILKRLAPVALLLAVFGLSACNTVEGVGRDVKATGKAIERAGSGS
jgi:predicted small secreted protein